MFFHRSGGGISWLLVGLGNPGNQYAATRHNMGFMALDRLADREGFRFNKLRFRAWTGQWKVGDRQVLVMKPQTYMNLSGESVGEAARFYKIPADHVLVISDDVSLPAGKLRIRGGGSAGGHNGLKNITSTWAPTSSPASRWESAPPGPESTTWWTGSWASPWVRTRTAVEDALDRAGDAAKTLITEGIDRAMNRFN